MYDIAICDDDKTFISYLSRLLEEIADGHTYQIKIHAFMSGEELMMSDVRAEDYALLFLDIQMPGMDGNQTAKMFRVLNRDAVLVFCSGACSPTVRSFEATPFRYLMKSDSDADFRDQMKIILEEMVRRFQKKYVVGHYQGSLVKVEIKNILYIENAKRGSRIVTDHEFPAREELPPILVDEKLRELVGHYDDFVYLHSSYIVNMQHIRCVGKNTVKMCNGEELTVSRKYAKDFKYCYMKFLGRKY